MAVALVEMLLASSIVLLSSTEMRFVLLEMSLALVTVLDAALAIAVSRLEFRAITLASVSLRDAMMPSMRLLFDDSCVLSSVTAFA